MSLHYCAGLCIDLDLGEIKNSTGECLRLSPINRKLLVILIARADDLVTRQELFEIVWPKQLVNEDVLTRAMSDIRTQLAKLNATEKFIETLPKRGYRWLPALSECTADSRFVPEETIAAFSQGVLPRSSLWRSTVLYLVIAAVATMLLSVAVSWKADEARLRVALLPVEEGRPDTAEANANLVLRKVLRTYPGINLLSHNALVSRTQNPFPYLYREFDVRWIIESKVMHLAGEKFLELSLVDAQTGLEQRTAAIKIDSNNLQSLLLRALERELMLGR